jgi:TetR/AcrR family transcriptional repressor of mexJK operon
MRRAGKRGAGRPKDESKRADVLEAAGKCFLRHGFARTTMDQIARDADVSKLTLYSHFENKETLFKAMIEAKCREYVPTRSMVALADHDPRAALTEIGTGFVSLMTSPQVLGLFRVVPTESVKNPRIAELLYAAGPGPTLSQFTELLKIWIAQGRMEIREPERAADHWFSMLRGMVQFRMIMNLQKAPSADELRRHVEDCVEMFLRAYARRPGGNLS